MRGFCGGFNSLTFHLLPLIFVPFFLVFFFFLVEPKIPLECMAQNNEKRGKQRSPESSKSQSEWRERQTVLVSATMPPALLEASVKWGSRPILVRAKGQQKTDLLSDSESTETESQKSATAAIIEGVKDSLPPNLDHRYSLEILKKLKILEISLFSLFNLVFGFFGLFFQVHCCTSTVQN